MLHEINMVARHEELVYQKPPREEEAAASAGLMDPDKFPFMRLKNDLIKEYESVWSTSKGKRMIGQVEKYYGHSL